MAVDFPGAINNNKKEATAKKASLTNQPKKEPILSVYVPVLLAEYEKKLNYSIIWIQAVVYSELDIVPRV